MNFCRAFKISFGVILIGLACSALANNQILPHNETYLADIPRPEQTLGWEVGEWHARPEQITRYFEQLAAVSDRASIEVIGQSHEQRPLIHLRISSAAN